MKTTHTLLLNLLAWVSVFQLVGCVTISVEGESTGQMKRKITESEFYRHAALFYPNQELVDPREIPPLNSEQERSLQDDLGQTLKVVLRLHKAHDEVLRAYFGDEAAELPEATVRVVNNDSPEARTTQAGDPNSGNITIDVRVIQSMLRAALLTTYEVEIMLYCFRTDVECSAEDSFEIEAIAINTFLSKRTRVDQTPDRSVFGDLMNDDMPSSLAEMREMDADIGPLDWFEMRDVVKEFGGIDVRYDVQQLFLVAHEVGHIALDHFGPSPIIVTDRENDPEDGCSGRRAKERAADIYAGVLITFATPRNALADFLGAFGGTQVSAGFETFFSYAYDYAGFAAGRTTPTCVNYLPPAQRLAAIRGIYDSIRSGQVDAIIKSID